MKLIVLVRGTLLPLTHIQHINVHKYKVLTPWLLYIYVCLVHNMLPRLLYMQLVYKCMVVLLSNLFSEDAIYHVT